MELVLFFAGAASASTFLSSPFGVPAVAIAAVLATALRVVAARRWTGRARRMRTLAVGALLSLYAIWAYLAAVFGWLLAWTVSWPAVGAILLVTAVALVQLRRPMFGMRIPMVLPLGVWITACLLGWLREDGLVRCADYVRFRSNASVALAIPTTRALASCVPGDVLRVDRYPRRVWEAADGSRYLVTTQRGIDTSLGTPVPDPIEHSICEFGADGSRRTCVGEYKTQLILDSVALDRVFIAGWEGREGILYALPRSGPLRLMKEVRTDGGTGEGYYDPDADEIALLADECSGLRRFRASDLSPLPRLAAPFCPGETHYDAKRHEGIFCFAPVGPLAPLLLGSGDYLSAAFHGNPFSYRLLGASNPWRLVAMVWGCDFDPVRRRAWIALANVGVIIITDYDTGHVLHTWLSEPGLRSVLFDPVRRRLYVSNFLRGDVIALDSDTGREVRRWFVGRFARWVGLTRDRKSLLATSNLGVVRIALGSETQPP